MDAKAKIMTTQEKYPKFYLFPHYWIDANGLQLRCIKNHLEVKGNPRSEVSEGALYIYDAEMYNSLWLFGTIDKYEPIFKPQEGEGFIKDLEEAVKSATGLEFCYLKTNAVNRNFICEVHDFTFSIDVGNIAWACYRENRFNTAMKFDTAAYTDKLRQLGYYV